MSKQKKAPLTGHDSGSMEEQIEAALLNVRRADERLKQHLSELRVQAAKKGRVVGWSALGLAAAAWLLLPRRVLRNGLDRAKGYLTRNEGRPTLPQKIITVALSLLLPLLHARLTTKQASAPGMRHRRSATLWKLALDFLLPFLFKPRVSARQ